MKTPKSRSRAARKRSQEKNTGFGTAPLFREAREVAKRQYLHKIKSLQSLAEEYDETIRPEWMTPAYFKQAREEANLSQEELARVSGVSRLVIANYETGVSRPTMENADRIYTALEELGSNRAGMALIDLEYLTGLTFMKIDEAEAREIEVLSAHRQSMKNEVEQRPKREAWLLERITQRNEAKIRLEAAKKKEN